MRQLVQRQATQPIVPNVQMAQAAGERAQRTGLDALDAVAHERQLAERDEIAEPMGGDRGQPVADKREPLQLVQTGERARLDRADRAIVQIQATQAVAEAEERVRGQAVDPQPRDLDPRRPVRQAVQRRQRARLETVAGTFLRERCERDKIPGYAIAIAIATEVSVTRSCYSHRLRSWFVLLHFRSCCVAISVRRYVDSATADSGNFRRRRFPKQTCERPSTRSEPGANHGNHIDDSAVTFASYATRIGRASIA